MTVEQIYISGTQLCLGDRTVNMKEGKLVSYWWVGKGRNHYRQPFDRRLKFSLQEVHFSTI